MRQQPLLFPGFAHGATADRDHHWTFAQRAVDPPVGILCATYRAHGASSKPGTDFSTILVQADGRSGVLLIPVNGG